MTTPELRAPANRVSSRARVYWTVRALLRWVVIVGVVAAVVDGAAPHALAAVLIVLVVVAVAHLVVMPQWRYRVHAWETSATAVYTQTGWFRQERRIAPVARIQTVDTKRGPLEQLFRLSNVTVTTASAAGPLRIHGLDRVTADLVAADLTRRAQTDGGDGT